MISKTHRQYMLLGGLLVFLAIVLAFPVIDLYVTARFARWVGVPMWFWLLCSALAGLWLMRNERLEFRARTVAASVRPSDREVPVGLESRCRHEAPHRDRAASPI